MIADRTPFSPALNWVALGMLAEISEAVRLGRESGCGSTMKMFDAVHAANKFLVQALRRDCDKVA